jgi:hypothetical protein
MSLYIIGERHDVVRHGPLRFWAERGLVHIEDSRDNSFETNSVAEMLVKMNAISDMLRRPVTGLDSPAERDEVYRERERLQTLLEGLLNVVRKAREQGMPTDPSAAASLKAARPKTVAVPRVVDMEDFPL